MTTTARDAAKIIQKKAPNLKPKIAIVLGSGLSDFANQIENPVVIPYNELPGFPQMPPVEGHGSSVYLGTIKGVPVACLQGRAHYYEGTKHDIIKTMVRTMKLIGCETWLATNASGSLRKEVKPGSLVLLKDHINFQFTNVLVGPNDDEFGPRFPPMEDVYDPGLRERFFATAKRLKIPLTEGVYVGVLGPAFETPAEINAYRILGADLVGMSTVSEVTVARHCGMKSAVIAVVTNMAAGMNPHQLSHQETLEGAAQAATALTQLVTDFITHA